MTILADVARAAGCSITTASRALGGYPEVSTATRERVSALAVTLNYHPNAIARQLQGQRTRSVAYAAGPEAGGREDLVYRELVALLARECAERDLDLLLIGPHRRYGPGGLARLVQRKRTDGVIVADTHERDPRIQALAAQHVPYVAFGRVCLAGETPFVDVDGRAGMMAVLAHLAALGHRRIAYLGGPVGRYFVYDRRKGYEDGLMAHGLASDPALCREGLVHPQDVQAFVRRLLDLPDPPSALMAMSDLIAVQALPVLHRRGLVVGRDIALTGFDDTLLASALSPPLTSVHQPFPEVCCLLLEALQRQIEHPDEPVPCSLVAPILVVRPSSAGPAR
ncbi:MAG: LacI family DNA-binding transcriptional regulator [Chloroflexota bacterium]